MRSSPFFYLALLPMVLWTSTVLASPIDLNAIEHIESSHNPKAWNKRADARGLFQITKVVCDEYSSAHSTYGVGNMDLFNGKINKEIAKWYLTKRIPEMLKSKGYSVTIRNIIVAYNRGISKVSCKKLPKETRQYLSKYHKLTSKRG